MKYTLTRPCKNCPFRTDIEPYLAEERVEEILDAITRRQATFSCHELNDFVDGEAVEGANSQHCAGALIFLEKIERPNQMMRIAERIGMYDRTRLHMDSPVYADEDEMLAAFAGC